MDRKLSAKTFFETNRKENDGYFVYFHQVYKFGADKSKRD